MQMVFYYLMIYSPETNNQGKIMDYTFITSRNWCHYIHVENVANSQCYILCAWWVLDVASDPSCCPPGSPMGVSSPPLLQINCLSCSPLGGPGSPSAPFPKLTPFPSGSTHLPIPPSATVGSALKLNTHNWVCSTSLRSYLASMVRYFYNKKLVQNSAIFLAGSEKSINIQVVSKLM
jgi:hypothetical protein